MLKPLILLAVSASIFLQATCNESSAYSSSSSSESSESSAVSSRRVTRNRHKTSTPRCTTSKKGGKSCKCEGKNEIYAECPPAVCVPKTCDDVGYPVPCPDLLPNATCPEKPACICGEGYVRSKSGECIHMTECSSCGGDENAVSGCSSNNCNRLCSNYDKPPQPCPRNCPYNSCECRKGYVYDEIKKICVNPRKCSKLVCTEPNQVYDPCPAPCPLRTCGINDAAVDCVPALSPGNPDCAPPKCRCKDGFYKNDVGQCVTLDKCPVCTGDNEIYDPCRAPCPPQRCDVDITVILCAVPPQVGDPDCDPGCRCIDGYVRNYTGRCIPREDCPQCPTNQVYDKCIAPCPPRRCDVDERLIRCAAPPKPGSPDCVEGCRCVDGYVKDNNDVCIPRDQCPKCTKPHEVYDPCPPSTCPPPTCENVNKKYNCPNIPVTTGGGKAGQTCEGQCVCEKGYFRNLIGECIAKADCLKCTGPNEYFSCGPACDNECSKLDKQNQTNCPFVNVKCNPKCYCKEGYARDDNKICIPIEKCNAKCTGPNEYFSCGPACDNECDKLDKQNQTNCPIKNKRCNSMCYCEEGYARDENKICIPIKDCKVSRCKKNEVYDPCPACKPLNCSQLGFGPLCESVPEGDCPVPPACVCKENYVRDDKTGICIPQKKCPSCGGDRNATVGCGVNCNKRCRDIGQEPGACILVCYENECDCKDGYYLDENTDQCVLPEDCTPVCPINEIYSTCTQAECRPKNCSQLGFPVACPRIDPKFCKKGCVCKNNYVRDKNGVCIPQSKCPSCGGDKNAIAGCGGYCNQKCSNIGQKEPEACILICNLNACDCREGYFYDEVQGKCVLPENCTPQCPKNEYYSNCTNGDCSVQNCTQVGFPIKCTRIDPKYCKKGCLCNEGYARNRKGVCIPIQKCATCKGDSNRKSGCGVYCNQKCSDIGQEPRACIDVCYENACDCKEGYYLDETKDQCVLPEDCTPTCPKNEYYSNCTNGDCSVQNCTQLGFPINCQRIDPKYCKKGCLCNEGYARNRKGVCIPIQKCATCKGDSNRKSGCGVYCNQKCSDIGQEPGACIDVCYENACDCKEGYYLDETKDQCVLPEDCTPTCPKNEYYSNCTNGDCSVQNCTQLGFPINCQRIDPKYCKKGCLCNEGYARNRKGVCIPIQKCATCKGDSNRKSGCGVYCNQKCSDIGQEPGACIDVCYENACDCKEGYYLDETKDQCVLPEDCTPTCPKNEYYSSCTNGDCSVQNCTQVGFPIQCSRIDPKYCKKGCLCNEGYARNRKGVCIPIQKCATCKGDPNQKSGCGVYCNQKCSDIGQEPRACIEICYENACDCKDGYYLDETKDQCVLPEDCTPTCPKNEYYSNCTNGDCSVQNCTQLGFPINCPRIDPKYCKKGCLCNEGYARNQKGVCVPIQKCPTCKGDPNRKPGCGVYCNQKCSDIGQEPRACILICYENACDCKEGYYLDGNTDKCVLPKDCSPVCGTNEEYSECVNGGCDARNCTQLGKDVPCVKLNPKSCIKGCVCIKGYLRDKNGVCVPESECNPPVCGTKEEYSDCVNGGCDARNCSQLGKDIPCKKLDPKSCIKGCICIKGYLRDKNGVCVPESECNPQCQGQNEEYNPCPVNCPPNTCESLNRTYNCPLIRTDGKRVCKGRCVCKKGFYRNKIGDCISEADCLKCTGPYEFFSCGGACDNVCQTLSEQNQTSCPIINIQCNKMCYCEKGYARARNKTCIPIDRCGEPQCGVNETLETCPEKLSGPFCCSQLGYPVKDNSNRPCGKSACVCIDGYLRNKQKVCIPKEECPSCREDENAVTGCGVNCGKRCEDLQGNGGPCPKICKQNACDCRDGYYYDKVQGKCVLPEQCTSICGENEQFENCTNPDSICRPKTCAEVGFPLNCTDTECKKGCYCIDNYVRDANGKCIPIRDCPSCGGDKNAVSGCGVNCGKTCRDAKNPGKQRICPLFCKLNSCDCRDGFYFDQNIGMCVPPEECPPICGTDEEYDPCSNGGCEFRNCSQIGGPQICIDPIKCIKGCKCKKDYLRLKNGTCVPVETCPEAKCRKNERFVKCPLGLCQPLTCKEVGFPVPCPDLGPDGYCPGGPNCICKENYVRNADGICIPKEKCPSCGGDPYARSGCGVNCGTHCDDVFNITRPCPRICYPNDCDCIKGYFYDEVTEKCVPANKCTPPCNENEVRDFCVNGYCGIRKCSEIDGPILCVDPIECEVGCTCAEGYLRLDSTNECVPECECPKEPENSTTTPDTCTDDTSSPVNVTTALANFQKGNLDLTTELLYLLVSRRPGESFMFSAFSILIALAQLALYAIGVTFQQLMALLNLKTKSEIRTMIPILIKNYRAQESVIFKLAIKDYGNINVPFSPKFKQEAVSIFDSEGENLDFSKNVEAAETINKWVANKTNNLIKDLVSADMFSADTRLVLVNALYFLGDWAKQFNPNNTTPRDFYIGEKDTDVVTVPTMFQEGRFKYGESEEFDCQILQLPYKGGNFTIDFYLPNKRTGLAEMVNKIRNSDNFAKIRESLRYETVRMYIPRIDISTDLSDLTELLKLLNLTAPFEPGSDELKCIFEDDTQNVYISDTIQKSTINITETGTEAAVATAVVLTSRSSLPTSVQTFEANHPFVFIIKFLDTIVFAGVFWN